MIVFSSRLFLPGVALLALLLRIGLILQVQAYPERFISDDAIGYDRLALNLLHGNGFSMRDSAPYVPDYFRTPGYPLFIAFVYGLAGYSPVAVLIVQAVLSSATCLVAYALGRSLVSKHAGCWAALLFAVSPISITYGAVLWSDTLFVLLFTSGLLVLVVARQRSSLMLSGLAGLALGIATLVHPRALYFVPLLGLGLGLSYVGSGRLPARVRRGILALLVFLCAFGSTLAPWYYRNHQLFGEADFSSAAAFNMLFYWAALLEVDLNGGNQWEIARRYEVEALQRFPAGTTPTAVQLSRAYYGLAVEKLVQHPLRYMLVHIKGTLRVFMPGSLAVQQLLTGKRGSTESVYSFMVSGTTTRDMWQSFWGSLDPRAFVMVLADIAILLVTYAAAARGVWLRRRSAWTYVALATIAYLVIVAGPAGAPRFRLAFTPILCVLAAIALERMGKVAKSTGVRASQPPGSPGQLLKEF